MKPFNVSRFIDGLRRRDRTYTAIDFLQIRVGPAQGTVSGGQKNCTRIHNLRHTTETIPHDALRTPSTRLPPSQALPIDPDLQTAVRRTILARAFSVVIQHTHLEQHADLRFRIAAFIIRQHGYLSQW